MTVEFDRKERKTIAFIGSCESIADSRRGTGKSGQSGRWMTKV